jgi:hypothetical protein
MLRGHLGTDSHRKAGRLMQPGVAFVIRAMFLLGLPSNLATRHCADVTVAHLQLLYSR